MGDEQTRAYEAERQHVMVAPIPLLEPKDETIPLIGGKMSLEAIEHDVNPLIQQRLRVLLGEGWRAAGATDVLTLWRQGRLDCREHCSFWMERRTFTLTSVTVRLRRISTA